MTKQHRVTAGKPSGGQFRTPPGPIRRRVPQNTTAAAPSSPYPERAPRGIPSGGQYAATPHDEATTGLNEPERTVLSTGMVVYKLNGKLHREDGPAVTHPDGTEEWWNEGQRHRIGGPAITRPDGTEEYWAKGGLHREDGPAVFVPGRLSVDAWYLNGERHRIGGPALVRYNGTEEWWRHGKRVETPQ